MTLLYEHSTRIQIRRARVPRPGEPDALTPAQQGAVERAAARRGVRDQAIVAVLLYAGARVEECGRLDIADVAITARTGTVRLHGKGDEVRTIPCPNPPAPGSPPGWIRSTPTRRLGGVLEGLLTVGQRYVLDQLLEVPPGSRVSDLER